MQGSPSDYEKSAVIAAEAGREALSRLDWMMIQPNIIVDVGGGLSEITRGLQQRYPNGHVLTTENIASLADASVDMVFANLVPLNLKEWRRILRPEGLLMFTAFGVDTLQQLRHLCNAEQMPLLLDMHSCGDMLVQTGFADPVLDVDYYTLSYKEPEKLWYELYASNVLRGDLAAELKDQLQATTESCYELTYEVIHAHAFAPQQNAGFKPGEDGVTRIPVSQLIRRR
jgi:malonyl-CoA O-methyltransferase